MNDLTRRLITCALWSAFFAGGCVESNPSGDRKIFHTPDRSRGSRLDTAGTELLAAMLRSYYGLKNALTQDDASSADMYAHRMIVDIRAFSSSPGGDTLWPSFLMPLLARIDTAVHTIVSVKDESCEYKRIAFQGVSDNLALLIQAADFRDMPIYRQYCPMAFNDRGAYWLSEDPEVKNPYFGSKMLECGEVSDTLY